MLETIFKILDIKWFTYNTLTTDVNETKYLPFASYSNHLPNMELLHIDHLTEISEFELIKYLGIMIDRHFCWDVHKDYPTNELRRLLSVFKYLIEYCQI